MNLKTQELLLLIETNTNKLTEQTKMRHHQTLKSKLNKSSGTLSLNSPLT